MTQAVAAGEAVAAPIRAKAGSSTRNGGIDSLRAAVTLLVVLHHTAITYGAAGGWYYKEIAQNKSAAGLLLVLFTAVNQAWFMGLFFLLAGYFTPGAYARHGAPGFLRERLLRLGLPLLVYFLLIGPATIALAQTAKGRPFTRTLLYLWSHNGFEPGPLWFAEALLFFAALFVAWRLVRSPTAHSDKSPFPSNGELLGAALLTGIAAFLLRLVWPVGVNVFALQLGYFASYVVLFVAGCAAADNGWLESIPAGQTKLWRRIAWIVLPVLPLLLLLAPRFAFLQGANEGGWTLPAIAYAFWEPFVAWGLILALLSFFQRRFATLGGVWPSLARRAFLIYITHPPVVVATALAWRHIEVPALLKFAVTGSIACVVCYFVAGLLLRIPGVARVV